jgi:TPP-dependent pyruvate/acetoin dehydrogenase alpha subunit
MADTDRVKQLYKEAYRIRYYNERIEEEFDADSDIPSGVHGSLGQEAPAVGVCAHLRADDWALASHRSAHIAIAKGSDLKALIAEQLGKAGGISEGKAGEQHILDRDANFISGAIVAQHLPTATGLALAQKKRGTDNVVAGFVGDGAANQGGFYECLNFASVHDLPIVFVIEDNDLGISTRKNSVTAVEDNSKRAEGQDMPGKRLEDNDVLTVYEEAGEAIERARAGEGPTLMEIKTPRIQGHFFADPEGYRTEEEMEELREIDCMPKLREVLREAGVADEEVEEMELAVEEPVDEAIQYALDQPYPDAKVAVENVFSSGPTTGVNND